VTIIAFSSSRIRRLVMSERSAVESARAASRSEKALERRRQRVTAKRL
jgi:hypothetical protein